MPEHFFLELLLQGKAVLRFVLRLVFACFDSFVSFLLCVFFLVSKS